MVEDETTTRMCMSIMDHFWNTKEKNLNLKCCRKSWYNTGNKKKKATDILWDVNIEESWLVNCVVFRKLKDFGCVECDSGLVRTVMEGVLTGRGGRDQPTGRWAQDNKDTLGMRMHEAGEEVKDWQSIWHMITGMFCQRLSKHLANMQGLFQSLPSCVCQYGASRWPKGEWEKSHNLSAWPAWGLRCKSLTTNRTRNWVVLKIHGQARLEKT